MIICVVDKNAHETTRLARMKEQMKEFRSKLDIENKDNIFDMVSMGGGVYPNQSFVLLH